MFNKWLQYCGHISWQLATQVSDRSSVGQIAGETRPGSWPMSLRGHGVQSPALVRLSVGILPPTTATKYQTITKVASLLVNDCHHVISDDVISDQCLLELK